MTPPKNGNRKLIIIIATALLLPFFGWVFNEVVWGGIQENKEEVGDIQKTIAKQQSQHELDVNNWEWELKAVRNDIENEAKDRRSADSAMDVKVTKILDILED